MQSDIKTIIDKLSEDENKQYLTDLYSFVFKDLSDKIKKPPALIIWIKGFGNWYLRKARLQKAMSYYPEDYETSTQDEFKSDREFFGYIAKREFYNNTKERLLEYEEFVRERQDFRDKRNNNATLPKIIDRKAEGEKPW